MNVTAKNLKSHAVHTMGIQIMGSFINGWIFIVQPETPSGQHCWKVNKILCCSAGKKSSDLQLEHVHGKLPLTRSFARCALQLKCALA